MAKKKFGKFIALATVSGMIAAGISYFLKYKSFHDELDEDFHDFEGDDEEFNGELPHEEDAPARTYVSLTDKKEAEAEAETVIAEVEEMAAEVDAVTASIEDDTALL